MWLLFEGGYYLSKYGMCVYVRMWAALILCEFMVTVLYTSPLRGQHNCQCRSRLLYISVEQSSGPVMAIIKRCHMMHTCSKVVKTEYMCAKCKT